MLALFGPRAMLVFVRNELQSRRVPGAAVQTELRTGRWLASGRLEMKGRVVDEEGKTAEVDGGYFGGYVKPANQKEYRRDRRLPGTKTAGARLLS